VALPCVKMRFLTVIRHRFDRNNDQPNVWIWRAQSLRSARDGTSPGGFPSTAVTFMRRSPFVCASSRPGSKPLRYRDREARLPDLAIRDPHFPIDGADQESNGFASIRAREFDQRLLDAVPAQT